MHRHKNKITLHVENVFNRESVLSTIKSGTHHKVNLVVENFSLHKKIQKSDIARSVILQGAIPFSEIEWLPLCNTSSNILEQAGMQTAISIKYQICPKVYNRCSNEKRL